jgi:hypothetical protein
MEFEVISILADKRDIGGIVSTIKTIQFKNPNLSIGTPKYGQLSNKMIISYKVPKEQHKEIVGLFLGRSIKIISRNDDVVNLMSSSRRGGDDSFSQANAPGNEIRMKKPTLTKAEVEENAQKGNYPEVLRVLKETINYTPDVVERAKALLPEAISRGIKGAYNNGVAFQSKAEESVDALVKIASDSALKSLNRLDDMREAGFCAIELCARHVKHIDKLINICNNNTVPHIVNLKSAVKFSEVVFSDETKFRDDLDIAVRDLNNRWMDIAVDIAGRELNEEENELLNRLLGHIRSKR